MTYGIIFNTSQFRRFKKAYGYRVDGDPSTVDEFAGRINSSTELLSYVDKYGRSRDLCYIGTGLLFVLNLVDATVDAHLFNFDVSDNLSLKIEPEIRNLGYRPYTGARLTLVLK